MNWNHWFPCLLGYIKTPQLQLLQPIVTAHSYIGRSSASPPICVYASFGVPPNSFFQLFDSFQAGNFKLQSCRETFMEKLTKQLPIGLWTLTSQNVARLDIFFSFFFIFTLLQKMLPKFWYSNLCTLQFSDLNSSGFASLQIFIYSSKKYWNNGLISLLNCHFSKGLACPKNLVMPNSDWFWI